MTAYREKLALLSLGDVEGHPFRGNQWTEGEGGDSDTEGQRWRWGTYAVKKAVSEYTLGGARYINEHLRAGKGPRWANRNDVLEMDTHMTRNRLPKDTTLSRTVPTSVVASLDVGDVYQDDGFVSTTADPAALAKIQDDIGVADKAKQSTLTVLAPKGLGHINVNEEIGTDHRYARQQEVILPRGLKYKVVSKGPNGMTVQVQP